MNRFKILFLVSSILFLTPNCLKAIEDEEIMGVLEGDETLSDYASTTTEDNQKFKTRDPQTGLYDVLETLDDTNRITFLYQVNNDLASPTDLTTFEFNYAHRFELAWLELFILKTTGKFSELTSSNPLAGTASNDLNNSDDDVLAFGAGLSYRGFWIQEIVGVKNIFTTTGANLGHYRFNQNYRGQTYSGFGIKADFGLHLRTNAGIHYGMRVSYNAASTKRPAAYDSELSSARAQLLGWLTFGVDLSFYF